MHVAETRDDYASTARLAQVLYEDGLESRRVLAACYRVGFPDEFFVVAEELP